mgnify:CR=1 FL=1
MNYYKMALWLAIASIVLLLVILFSPAGFEIFQWKKSIFNAGALFLFLVSAWVLALLALAFNYIHAENLFVEDYEQVSRRRKYFPALLTIPSISSFLWFCYECYLGIRAY